MRSVNQEVHNLIHKHISIQKCLKRSIINTRSLAKFLVVEYNLPYTLDAVISAIRRYDLHNVSLFASQEASRAFSSMGIQIKDRVAKLILKDSAFREIAQDYVGDKVLRKNTRLIKSKEKITLIVRQNDLAQKLSVFRKQDLLEIVENLAEIRLQFELDVAKVKGIVATISGELALHDINIEEVIYSIPDLLIYVKENDLVRAHEALREMKK